MLTFKAKLRFIVSRVLVICRRGLDWWVDLLGIQQVTTNNYNTLKITVIITHEKSHRKSSQADFQFFPND
jgi:hypothetical protein